MMDRVIRKKLSGSGKMQLASLIVCRCIYFWDTSYISVWCKFPPLISVREWPVLN